MQFLRSIRFAWWAALACVLLIAVSMYSIHTANYVWIYTPFFLIFVALVAGYALLNKQKLLQLVYFFVPLSLGVGVLGDAEMQLPTEPLIGLLVLLLLASASGLSALRRDVWRHPVSLLLVLELGWLLICSLNSELKLVSFKFSLIRVCYVTVFFFITLQWLRKEDRPERFYLLYLVGMLLPIVLTFIHHAALDFSPRTAYHMPKPFYNDHTVFGACVAFILPMITILVLNGKLFIRTYSLRVVLAVLLVVLLAAEFFSYSRAAWLSLIACGGLLVLIRLRISGKFFLMLLVVAAITVGVFKNLIVQEVSDTQAISSRGDVEQHFKSITNIQTDASNKERINRWNCAIRMGIEKPVLGFGPRTYKYFYGRYQERKDMTYTSTFNGTKGHAHSDYLMYLAECGWLGFLLHIALYLMVMYKGINLMRDCRDERRRKLALGALLGVFTFFIHGIFNGFMEEDKMASLVFVSMAVLVYLDEMNRRPQPEVT